MTDSLQILCSDVGFTSWRSILEDAAPPGTEFIRVALDGAVVDEKGPVEMTRVAPQVAWMSTDSFYDGTGRAIAQIVLERSSTKWLHTASAGIDMPVFEDLLRHGVRVSCSRTNSIAIAEWVLASVLNHYQQPQVWWANQTQHIWKQTAFREVWGSTWLVFGLGAIGQAVAERARAFGAKVIGVRRRPTGSEPVDEWCAPDDLLGVVPRADVVLISAPSTDSTYQIVNPEFLARMKAGSVLVNVARGSLIDEAALFEALDRGVPERALLDVFVDEPLPPDSPMWSHPGVTVTPHTSAGGLGRFERAARSFTDNLGRFLERAPLANEVTLDDVPSRKRQQVWHVDKVLQQARAEQELAEPEHQEQPSS